MDKQMDKVFSDYFDSSDSPDASDSSDSSQVPRTIEGYFKRQRIDLPVQSAAKTETKVPVIFIGILSR